MDATIPAADRQFRFVVIADTHVNPSDTDGISPFESHRLTNTRLRHTVSVVNGLKPELVMHVGDMVHPVPEAVSYAQAVSTFRASTEGLRMPMHVVAGNHDCGDKPARYVPAGSIKHEYVEQYEAHFGAHYYSFDHRGCHFVVINTSLFNADLPQAAAQAQWLENDLSSHGQKRCFLFMHYPPFIAEPNERGHYDNIDEPARGWLLELVQRHGVDAAFTGHVHNFFLNRCGETPFYLMPSTAFARADYAEVFRAGQPPENESGRNDTAKLGMLVVDVYADRIVPQFIRTLDTARIDPVPEFTAQRDWPRLPPAAGPQPTLAIDMRHEWTALHDIPYSSMLDEFQRKQARNDYPILALLEMGVRHLRVPLDDLLREPSRARMQLLASMGVRFTAFGFGVPAEDEVACLAQYRDMLEGVELVLPWPPGPDIPEVLVAVKERVRRPLAISRFRNATGDSRDGKQIKLLVDHGFTAVDRHFPAWAGDMPAGLVDSAVFRIGAEEPAAAAIDQAVAAATAQGMRAAVHVRVADDSPAGRRMDEWHNTLRVIEAAMASHHHTGHAVILDTLIDVDRGYFPRVGLIDRLCNPRLGGRVLRNLNGLLSELGGVRTLRYEGVEGGTACRADVGRSQLMLVLPTRQDAGWNLELPADGRETRCLDLITGMERAVQSGSSARVLHGRPGELLAFFSAD